MCTSSRTLRRSAVALAVATATTLTGCSAAPAAEAAAPAASCDEPVDDASVLPEGVEDGSRLFLSTYRFVVVQVTCGRVELVEPTGFDSCYFLHEDQVLGYPC